MTSFFRFIQPLMAQRWVRFALVGGAATASYYLLGIIFVPVLGLPVLAGNTLAYVLSFAVSYLGQSQWTFAARRSHATMLPRYAATQGIGLAINSGIIAFLTSMGVRYELAMIIAIVTVPVAVYCLCKYWVFRDKDKA